MFWYDDVCGCGVPRADFIKKQNVLEKKLIRAAEEEPLQPKHVQFLRDSGTMNIESMLDYYITNAGTQVGLGGLGGLPVSGEDVVVVSARVGARAHAW